MNECDKCHEYKDYHCEKWCKVIRQTVADLEEYYKNSIPIDWIEQYLYDLSVDNEEHLINVGEILSMSDEEYYLKNLIKRWKQEQEEQNKNT